MRTRDMIRAARADPVQFSAPHVAHSDSFLMHGVPQKPGSGSKSGDGGAGGSQPQMASKAASPKNDDEDEYDSSSSSSSSSSSDDDDDTQNARPPVATAQTKAVVAKPKVALSVGGLFGRQHDSDSDSDSDAGKLGLNTIKLTVVTSPEDA